MTMTGILSGAYDGMDRATKWRTLARGASALVLVALIALAEKRAALFGAASRVLQSDVFGFILPVALLLISRRILAPARLDMAATPLARFGPSRRAIALGLILASAIGSALIGGAAGAIAAALAHDPTAPAAFADALSSAWIGALGAAAYAAYFAFGATYGRSGGGRFAVLVADALLGSTAGIGAVLTPRAHIQNLLGGEPPMLMTQHASTASLALMTAFVTALALLRCPP